MNGRLDWIAGAALGVILLFSWNPAFAVITAKTPLSKFEGDAVYILVGKVEKFYADKPAMMVTVVEDIKGKAPFRKLPINCKVDDKKTSKENLIEPLLKRFGADLQIIFFIEPHGKSSYLTFAFTNGTWFQLQGSKVDKDQAVFALKSAEPYFRKSFKGTTEELRKLLKDHAGGTAKLPPLDDKVQPGLGPEYMPMQKSERWRLLDGWIALKCSTMSDSQSSLFAVIPTIGLGAPLAILALLFPILHYLFAPTLLRGTWWDTEAAQWFLMTVFTFACAFWAWRRQLNALSDGAADAPQKTELAVLLFMSASCIATTVLLWYLTNSIRWSDVGWTLMVVMTLSILAGTLHKCWSAFRRPAPFASVPLATEGVILGAMLLGHLAFAPAILEGNINTQGVVAGNEQSGSISAKVVPVIKKWDFTLEPRMKGMFASSPVVDGDAVYASYSRTNGYATLIRLDRHSGMQKWEFFGKHDDLRQMISTPCLSGGRLYFGEGFHYDKNCHVFCVDAENGEEVWRFKTAGQTESSPTVAHGRLYIGAGNDGVYCLDAKFGGPPIWKYPPPDYPGRKLRFGGGMAVVGNQLYCGTGVDREEKIDKGETAVFCLDAVTGKLIWKTAAPYPVWSTPVIKDGIVYVTSGNGDVFTDVAPPEKPGGALQCLNAETGKEHWNIKLDNGVIEAPAVDAHRIYFGCRDSHIYCVSRADGKLRWRYFLESPIIATPVLDSDPVLERTVSVFVISTGGKVCCMSPQTGDMIWRFDLTDQRAAISTSPRLVVTRAADGYTRHLYFGCGLGGGTDIYDNRPFFYCLEDKVKVE
jgi:outer membrane protein assembly factor BamB